MRVLFDTSVLVSGLHFKGTPGAALDLCWAHAGVDLVVSPIILDELERVLVDKIGWSPEAAAGVRLELLNDAESVDPVSVTGAVRDPNDDHVIGAALAGHVDLIVTGDADLLTLGSYEDIDIVSPAEFVRQMS